MEKIKKTVYLRKEIIDLLETISYERGINYSEVVSEAIKNLASDEEVNKSLNR